MRGVNRLALAVMLLALGSMLAACGEFDPDKLDFLGLNDKKKLPGDRKALFPEGVPGVTQGIPREYMKGYQPPPDSAPATAAADDQKQENAKQAAIEPEPKPKPKRKPKPKPRTVEQPPTQITVQPSAKGAQAPWPAQAPQQQPQQNAPASSSAQQGQDSSWPNAPQPGTFSR